MADAATGSERRFDATVYSPLPTSGEPSSSDRVQDTAVRPTEAGADINPELTALLKLGALKQEMACYAEAEEFFRKALEVGDRMFGPEHQEMIILLNDLTRLYLKQGSYASAEPLLLRLLDLKKSKGEDHPEVATVLASLATVRQSLGLHESAEQLWRHVVDIRERTLAPNHFATATALEHLGESCAARGKNRAALAAFERAQLIRERTLGSEHPSVRTSRERIADLQLQGSDDSLYPEEQLEQLAKPPERFRLSSGDRPAPSKLQPVAQDRVEKDPNDASRMPFLVMPRPTGSDRQLTNSETSSEEKIAADAQSLALSAVAGYREALEDVRRELEEPAETAGSWVKWGNALASLPPLLRGRGVAGTLTISAIALLLLGSAAVSRASSDGDRAVDATSPNPAAPPIIPSAGRTDRASAQVENVATFTPTAAASKPTATPSRAVEAHSATRKSAERAPQPNIAIPTLSTAVMSGVEAIASRAGNTPARGVEPFAPQSTDMPVARRRSTFADDQVEQPQHARLIGEVPKPTVPFQLANIEGDVRLRFTVDTTGRPVMSTVSVVNSTHPALTDAVKRVIPSMRFEPARSGGSDSRPVTEVVQLGFVFSSHRP